MQPNPTDVGIWMAVLVMIIGAASNVVSMFANFRTQKVQARLEERFATVAELKAVELDVKELRASIAINGEARRIAIEGKVQRVEENVTRDIGELRKELSAVSGEVREISATCELTNQRIVQFDTKVTHLLERAATFAARKEIGV